MAIFGDTTVTNFSVSKESNFYGKSYFRKQVTFINTVKFLNNIEISHKADAYHLNDKDQKEMLYSFQNPSIIWSDEKGDEPVKIMYNCHDSYREPAGLKVLGDPERNSHPAWFEVEGDTFVGGDIIVNGAIQQGDGDIYTDHRFLSNNKNENKVKIGEGEDEKLDPDFDSHYPAFEVRGGDKWNSIIWEVNNAPDNEVPSEAENESEYKKEMLMCNWVSMNGYFEVYKGKENKTLELYASKKSKDGEDRLIRTITQDGDITIGKYFTNEEIEKNPKLKRYGNLTVGNNIKANKVYGAVWNDLTDLIEVPDDTVLEYGKCYVFDGKKYFPSKHYGQKGIIGIHSDTSGFSMGLKPSKTQLSIAVAGFVLAYVDKDYPPGTALTCSKDGSLTKLKKIDKILNPENIVGTFYKPEEKEAWYGIKVNGRKWIKVL